MSRGGDMFGLPYMFSPAPISNEQLRDFSSRSEDIGTDCPLAGMLAERMRASRLELTQRWLERIIARVEVPPAKIFPTDDLLNHVPVLILGIADYIESPTKIVLAEMPVVAKAMELGQLRFAQGFDAYEVLKEYEIFGGILFAFLTRTVDSLDQPCTRGELLACAHRVFIAVALIQQATLTNYLSLLTAKLAEREERLRGFNRTLSHELTNRITAIAGAAQVMELDTLGDLERQRLNSVVTRNVLGMQKVLENLAELSRLEDSRQQRHVTLRTAASEVIRQLRDAARAKGVELANADGLPEVEVNAAAVELCLSNLLSNSIKYADSARKERWVRLSARPDTEGLHDGYIVIEVRDNGIGVPTDKRERLFQRFFRAHGDGTTGAHGSGLGLSIVRETAESFGGRAWAEFPEDGSLFAFTLPVRRAADEQALGSFDPGLPS
jgi:signal transduction histidine kinase